MDNIVNNLELTVTPSQLKPTLRALLHAIFFHRLLDNVQPETFEILDVHVPSVPNPILEKDINTKVDQFYEETVLLNQSEGQLAVIFLQRRPKKGWFATTEELVPWEEHLITVHLSNSPRSTNQSLHAALLQTLTFCAEKKGNVPPLSGNSSAFLSHQILISPPSPAELFAPSSPPRRTSPPLAAPSLVPESDRRESRDRSMSPGVFTREYGAMGYLEQARDGLRARGIGVGEEEGLDEYWLLVWLYEISKKKGRERYCTTYHAIHDVTSLTHELVI
ncbi:hypothetical protein TREMEDRAFT_73413 [Tremella mesenterica DSM 1558]|uniref:uncharacterized protein n=1 Tax=Tremella mesenterica (strain ATCC 24925 / CBS 8224 / DSM 1558 / NBRC 9311 / NRRL Y-6157 / RJB 2259-6 / UBC 559-6) TaxID=578456 RepID=UPI0003F49335|nr:uncharacterized protein TREMEDRAFT_73413 [Tremella mesenterica DSM 1558]EIW71825.1 hypothetical protein TREMEDRAFT_73413 [Tremella mesenterica DSM 1558]